MIMAIGLVSGDMIYFVVVVTGLTEIITRFSGAILILKFIGVAYLIFLGWRLITSKTVAKPSLDEANLIQESTRESWVRIYFSGLLITLGSPQTMIFFLALLPELLDLEQIRWGSGTLLGAIVFFIAFGGLLLYAIFADAARKLFQNEMSLQRLNRISGVSLIACGLAIGFLN